ncbi:MAG TPA: ATP synthase F1 subunit delta [Candidatus Deferrimicrobiaceae bacterium]|jgi:F-type H+-transporting ATPase subunit delta|nr:ATP synthase F1 subunit delta [Candidatus Deferrimicrobiaceae bacterium]
MASVASTYARAFADVVFDAHLDADRAIAELRAIASLLNESSDLRQVWENPAIPVEQKRRVLDVIVQRDGISKQVRNLVAVLIDHRRTHFLDAVIRQVEKELDARMGFAEAEITSVRELADMEKREFEQQVAKLTGKKIRAHYGRDASLLGGAVVRVGSTIYDGSVKGQLERMKEAISS